jgi:hypothetical protein
MWGYQGWEDIEWWTCARTKENMTTRHQWHPRCRIAHGWKKSKSFISQQRDILPCTLLLFFSFTWFIPRDDWMIASQSATTLYIYKMGRSCPCWSWRPNKSRAKIQLQLSLQSLDPVKPPGHPGLTGLCDVQIFQKSYLSHPDSELDVLYMDLDLLDETYPMGMSKLPFKDFG